MSTADVRSLIRSFSGGEVSPEIYGRIDLAKYQIGLAKCRNFIVLPHGPAINRSGTQYVIEVKDSTKPVRVIPFSYSSNLTYILEVGHLYIRFHTAGGTLLEAAQNITSISLANPGVFTINAHGYSNGQWLFLSGIGGMTALNGRFVKIANATTNTFTVTDLTGSAINTTTFTPYTGGGTAARVYEIASPYDTTQISLFDIHFVQSNNKLTLVHASYPQQELVRISSTNWTLSAPTFNPSIAAPSGVAAAPATGSGSTTYTYGVTAIDGTTFDESFISSTASCTNNLNTAGNSNQVTWSAVAGAIRYNVYKSRSGLMSFAGQTPSLSFIDDNILPDPATVPATQGPQFSSVGTYPAAVNYFEQRRVFAGTVNSPQTVYMTRSATESNMAASLPTRDNDAIAFKIAAKDSNPIRHVVPIDDLILLTAGGVWKIEAVGSDALTPTSISVRAVASPGATMVQPVVVGKYILHVIPGGHIQEVAFSWQVNGYDVDDKSIMAQHLFDNYDVVDIAYSYAPFRVLWGVRSDGILLGLTYLPKQEVLGWHWHDTTGKFESVASVLENGVDAPYFVVNRTIGNRTVRYIERLKERRASTLAQTFIVDAGLQYSGTPVNSVTGLYHLEGMTVSILADGAVMPQRTVSNGTVTLPTGVTASVINAGLPITADLQTLPLTYEGQGFGEGILKNVDRVHLRVVSSSGILAGPDFNNLTAYKQRTSEPYGSPPNPVTGTVQVDVTPSWSTEGQVCVRQTDPLPLTIAALVLEFGTGD